MLMRLVFSMMLATGLAPLPAMAAPETDVERAAGVDVHAGDDHAQPGLLDANVGTALWTVIIFAVLLVILYPTAWKSVLAGLKAREDRIRKDIADAEAASQRAQATLNQYTSQLADAENRVREMLAKAAIDGEKLATSIRMQAQQEAEETKERAVRDIDAAKEGAINEIYQEAATLATSVAEKILRRNLNANDQRDLVNQSLDQLQAIGKK